MEILPEQNRPIGFVTQLSGFISKLAFLNVPMGSVCRRGDPTTKCEHRKLSFVIKGSIIGICFMEKRPRNLFNYKNIFSDRKFKFLC
ncbi:hypothetical protein SAMN02746065_12022 [Desulfocicer vacuolatum DSM 3385]|uniref:Uncharacterized protein n=1 Tax=Desulfocicer vacuolatum DSM 3385 TaxID=1121400 RepID=A0A1W2DSD0_9BACT|nr:hypothetical protein SAMN02746065_12022 [Desulfocicer vacuolatum DSM 3385]